MRHLALILLLSIAAPYAFSQETKPSDSARAKERQFAGEVVSADAAAKSLSVKANGPKGETTLTLAVDDAVVPQLADLKPGDRVTVLWRQGEAGQQNLVVGLGKAPPAND
jgi:Ni/Co efflux regulator RcnB